jgi:hypothetical protein
MRCQFARQLQARMLSTRQQSERTLAQCAAHRTILLGGLLGCLDWLW